LQHGLILNLVDNLVQLGAGIALGKQGVGKGVFHRPKVSSNRLIIGRDYTHELLRAGFANYTDVLTAQQSLLQAQLNSVNDQRQQRQAVTDLYHALGGGWR